MSSGYQTMDFEEIQGNGDEEKEEEGEEKEEEEDCFEKKEDLISVCQSQVTDNSNSSDGEDKQDEQQDDSESSDVENIVKTEDSLFREGGKLNVCERLSLTSGRNGRNGDNDPQGTQSVTSTRKYQRTATRPPPGTVKSLMAKFQ